MAEGAVQVIGGILQKYLSALGSDAEVAAGSSMVSFNGISIDSRTVLPGNLFFCITGQEHDGHDFVRDALDRGAVATVMRRDRFHEVLPDESANVVVVRDTLAAMGNLSSHYLKELDLKKVAITGTNGKTTCKNLCGHVLGAKYRVCTTSGNFNNLVGVPLSIFEFSPGYDLAVLEFGMSTPGEILRLVDIVDPDVRVILNVGPAHLETMKTIEAVADAKFEILEGAAPDDFAVLNNDDPHIVARKAKYDLRRITFGLSADSDVHPSRVWCNGLGYAHLEYAGDEVALPVLGEHHVPNFLAAMAVAKVFDLPWTMIKDRLESFRSQGFRMAVNEVGGVKVINDAYNANPVSMKASIETVSRMQVSGRRVAVLGDMLELGDQAAGYHKELGEFLPKSRLDFVLLLGQYAEIVRQSAVVAGYDQEKIEVFEDYSNIVERLSKLLKNGDLLLLKASRALQFERIDTALKVTLGRRN